MALIKNKKISHSILILFVVSLLIITTLSGCDTFPETTVSTQENTSSDDTAADEESNIILQIEIAIGLLLIASLVGIVTDRLRVPYTTGLVLIGLVLAFFGQQDINVSPQLILGLLVPPLIYEAAFQVKAKDLLRDLAPIISLAIPGV